MSEWLKRLRSFSAEAQKSTRDNPRLEGDGLSRVIAGDISGESQNNHDAQPVFSHVTRLEIEPLESDLSVWDLLRSDWPALLDIIRESGDGEGLATVYSHTGGEVIPLRLDDPSNLANAVRDLNSRHGDPLEFIIHAVKGEQMILRSRQRRTMVPGRVIA